MGFERPLRKHAGGMFLGRGRIHGTQTHPARDVGCVPFFAFKEGFEKYNATVRRGVTRRRLDDGDTIIFAKGENVTIPIIHPMKKERIPSGILSFLSI